MYVACNRLVHAGYEVPMMWLERTDAQGAGVAPLRCLLPAACENFVCSLTNMRQVSTLFKVSCDMLWTEQAKQPVFREFLFHVGEQIADIKTSASCREQNEGLKNK